MVNEINEVKKQKLLTNDKNQLVERIKLESMTTVLHEVIKSGNLYLVKFSVEE